MKDKDVGELWAKYHPWTGLHGMELQAAKDACALIRKLVEERKIKLLLSHKQGALWTDEEAKGAERLALRDFGIPEDSWPVKN